MKTEGDFTRKILKISSSYERELGFKKTSPLPTPEASFEEPAVATKTAKTIKSQTFPTNIVPGLKVSPKMLRTETFIAFIMTWNTPVG